MATSYTYQTSSDFINKLQFDYIDIYSFQRGPAFDADMHRHKFLANEEKTRMLTQKERTNLCALIEKGITQRVIYKDGKIHPSGEKTHSFTKTHPVTKQIVNILKTDAIDVPAWMCAPFYRDAIIFYNNGGDIVSALNICFSCQYMAVGEYDQVNADVKTYKNLRELFIGLGHRVEER